MVLEPAEFAGLGNGVAKVCRSWAKQTLGNPVTIGSGSASFFGAYGTKPPLVGMKASSDPASG